MFTLVYLLLSMRKNASASPVAANDTDAQQFARAA
jgi:hypothetical protein